jgi:type IV pilus assembly protein PilA
MYNYPQKGFSLIKLMIVAAVISILAAVALSSYQDYAVRALVSEGLVVMAGAKTAFAKNADDGAFLPLVGRLSALRKM